MHREIGVPRITIRADNSEEKQNFVLRAKVTYLSN